MKIGTDVSIAECRKSGYVVIEYKAKELLHKGVLDKTCAVKVTSSYPENWSDAGKPLFGCSPLYVTNGFICFEAALEIFEGYGESIKSMIDFENCPIELISPSVYDFLFLLSAIESYSGLYTWGLDDIW